MEDCEASGSKPDLGFSPSEAEFGTGSRRAFPRLIWRKL